MLEPEFCGNSRTGQGLSRLLATSFLRIWFSKLAKTSVDLTGRYILRVLALDSIFRETASICLFLQTNGFLVEEQARHPRPDHGHVIPIMAGEVPNSFNMDQDLISLLRYRSSTFPSTTHNTSPSSFTRAYIESQGRDHRLLHPRCHQEPVKIRVPKQHRTRYQDQTASWGPICRTY